VHYVPVQNSYSDLLDTLVFFRAHDKAGARIAAAGREWSRRYWREEDLVGYMYRCVLSLAGVNRRDKRLTHSHRLFLEYARVMSSDRTGMSFAMWPDEREDAAREQALRARWERGEEWEAKE
jgi:hypothetical protein